ncbi:MAG: hypothetical protein E2O88_11035 [Bacteroidetes bacterium]|nr:MAG: hypothetical protein E2O88_11035 [Bacteroidota bacterium]
MTKLISIPLIIGIIGLVATTLKKNGVVPKFQAQVIDNEIQVGYGLAIGDVDGDGKDDILLADKKQFVWYRNGDWKRFVMVDNLTERDNVCLAARDINGDGQVEVAVGAQWNPGETSDLEKSGSVHYLIRPQDPTQIWQPIKLHHEPTVHRMRWVKTGDKYQLIVLPLHGRDNKDGQGAGVKVIAYEVPQDPQEEWPVTLLDQTMHLTHNLDVLVNGPSESLLIGGKEGAKIIHYQNNAWSSVKPDDWLIDDHGFGEIRESDDLIAGIQPLHGHQLVIYNQKGTRKVLTDSLKQGHALALSDLLSQGQDQVIVGWRNENDQGEIGIKMFVANDPEWESWYSIWIDKNGMACEDLKIADLDGDGKMDIIAAGRSTHNLKIYWNHSGK